MPSYEFVLDDPCPEPCRAKCTFTATVSYTETEIDKKIYAKDLVIELSPPKPLVPPAETYCSAGSWWIDLQTPAKQPRRTITYTPDGGNENTIDNDNIGPNKTRPADCDVAYWASDCTPVAKTAKDGNPYKVTTKPGLILSEFSMDFLLECRCDCAYYPKRHWTRKLRISPPKFVAHLKPQA
jgi:hypothetical protein